ncbi:MAG: hypothetical protein BWK79_04735 [Beggiatoa sp. IS2]|nr:MAG: hypothetical protein BWK79_04735 [Beggiatoa sp. IS2]
MLPEMRELALQNLLYRCKEPPDAEMTVIRERHGQVLSPLLVEDSEKVPRVYILTPQEKEGKMIVKMHVEDLGKDEEKARKLPFVKPTGSQSAAVGPVIKRTSKPKEQPPYGPSPKILKTTLDAFNQLATSNLPWSSYFQEIVTLLNYNTLEYNDNFYSLESGKNILEQAVSIIAEKETVFLVVTDKTGKLPGERQEYLNYLAYEMAEIKYVTGSTRICQSGTCPLCSKENVTLYPNAAKGAGLNIGNADRAGSFTGLDTTQAWKNFALCVDCADLLYIFKNHLLPQFIAQVTGEKALLLPSLLGPVEKHQKFIRDWRSYVQNLETNKIASYEKGLLKFFADQEDNQVTLQLIWATFGQTMDDVKGWITDILPSRLQKLSNLNDECNNWKHPVTPKYPVDEVDFDLGLNMLLPLFRRLGGKIAKKANESKQLFDFKRQLATVIYHQRPLINKEQDFLWYQVVETARWYLTDIMKRNDDYSRYSLTNEGYSEKKNKAFLTFAGWIRHLARFFYYLDRTGVLPMAKGDLSFEPQTETLKPFFAEGSGINSDEKAFAFILGALFGKLIQVQSNKGVNVNSNALTWLKRLELSGKDLPELYTKIRGKFFAYNFKKSEAFLNLEKDLGYLGAKLGDNIDLDKTATCYFLLLGQSITTHIFPKKETTKNELTEGTLL